MDLDCSFLDDACNAFVCDDGECAGEPINEGGECDDGDPVTNVDRCVEGECVGAIKACTNNPLHGDSFAGQAPGDAAGWLDTGAGNSMAAADDFKVFLVDGNDALGTLSTDVNIHSHVGLAGSDAWTDYTFTGRLRIEDADGGVGVTFLSDYTNSDHYYRLRRYAGFPTLHLSTHGTSFTGMGKTDTEIVPEPGIWYRFRIEVATAGGATELKARVWEDGTPEPVFWQAQVTDGSATRRSAGTIGVWSMGPGAKYWDDLDVASCIE